MDNKKKRPPSDASLLRERAEVLLRASPSDMPTLATADVQSLVHELNVHQMELEIQNEELRHAQVELTETRDRYADLYEFAPVGYLSLDRDGVIRGANLTADKLLSRERSTLIGRKLSGFVARDSQDTLHRHWLEAHKSENRADCELQITRPDESPLAVRLDTVIRVIEAAGDEGTPEVENIRVTITDITRRKQTEALQSLNEELERHVEDQTGEIRLQAKAIANLGEGVLITDADLEWPGPHIVFVNEAMCRITGYTADELIGQSPRILQGNGSERETLDRIKVELSVGRSCEAELVNHRKDGTAYDADLFITPLFDPESRRTNFVSIHRDITKRKRSEKALWESEERHRAILNAAVDAIITIDREGTIVAINPATEHFFGYAEDELLGRNVSILMPSPYRDEHDQYLASHHDTGEAQIIGTGREVAGRRKDGTTFPADLSVSKVEGLGLYTGIVRDITTRKQTEEALRNLYEFNENLIETAQNIILVLDPEGRVVRFNTAFEKLSGWKMAEAEGCDWFETFLPKRDRRRIKRLFAGAIRGESTIGNLSPILTKSGEEREIEWYDALLKDSEGTTIGLLCTGSDVTDRLRMEQEIVNASEQERQRIAQDLHDDLGSHLTGIDLRLKALTTILSKQGNDKEADNCRTAQTLVQDAVGKTRSIAKGLHAVGEDPDDLKPALKKMLERARDASNTRCQFRCPDAVSIHDPIMANQLFRIAQEAVNNAVKHSEATQITVSLSDSEGQISLKVTDNGTGLDRLERGSPGLGLHIMKYRASAMGGFLSISRRKSGGTKVVCKVPSKANGEQRKPADDHE